MIMPPGLRKVILTVQVATSVGLLGAVASFLVLALTGLLSEAPQIAQATYPAMELITRDAIVPLAYAALLIGIVQSLGTSWGLFQPWWAVMKLLLTLFTILVLTLQLGNISKLAAAASLPAFGPTDLRQARMAIVLHSGVGLLVLLMHDGAVGLQAEGPDRAWPLQTADAVLSSVWLRLVAAGSCHRPTT